MEITKNKFEEIELLKVLAILLLPATHIMEYASFYSTPELTTYGNYFIGLCATGPLTFMICMGFGMNNKGAKTSIRAGLQFLCIGFILNIFRWFLPWLVQGFFQGFDIERLLRLMLKSDIYYFVGLFFILYGLFKKIKLNNIIIFIISIVMLIINNGISPLIMIENVPLSAFLGNFIYVNKFSCFPLMSWFIYPMIGIILFEMLKNKDNTQQNILMILIAIISCAIIGLVTFIYTQLLYTDFQQYILMIIPPLNYYYMPLICVIISICLTLLLFAINFYVWKLVRLTPLRNIVLRFSYLIVPFYIIQWIVISWGNTIIKIIHIPEGSITILMYNIVAISVTIICVVLTVFLGKPLMKFLFRCTKFVKKIC